MSMGNERYKNIFKNSKPIQNDNISTVMLIEIVIDILLFLFSKFPTLQLYVELKLIKSLKSLGYKVIYKMHPEVLYGMSFKKLIGF